MLGLFLLSLPVVNSLNSCFTLPCPCNSTINYLNITCVQICPTGYIEANSSCEKDSNSSVNLFSLKFFDYWDFSVKEMGGFSLESSFYSGQASFPIFTKDRGFYFRTGDFIVSKKSWILAPNVYLGLTLKPMTEGTIFEVSDLEKYYLNLSVSKGSICLSLLLNTTDLYGVFQSMSNKSLCIAITYNKWSIVSLKVIQLRPYSQIYIYRYTEITSSAYTFFSYNDFLPQINGLDFTIGKKTKGFEGFLYEISMNNQQDLFYTRLYMFTNCDFGYYYDYLINVCEACSDSIKSQSTTFVQTSGLTLSVYLSQNFTDVALCTKKDSYCNSNSCKSCFGFYYGTCEQCFNTSLSPSCDDDFFSRTDCSSPLVLISNKSICANESTFPMISSISLPSFVVNFTTFDEKIGGIFQSGSKIETFAPFNNPEIDDPLPVKGRGMFFNGSSYLQSIIPISLNIEFTLAFWTKVTSSAGYSSTIWMSDYLSLKQDASGKICFTDGYSVFCRSFLGTNSASNTWKLVSLILNFDPVSKTSNAILIQNSLNEQMLSLKGQVHFNSPTIVYIGKGAQNLIGFIFKLAIWNSPFILTINSLNFCISSLNENCALSVDFGFYYNSVKGVNEECHKSCTEGCAEWGRCNVCKYADCQNCTSFTSNCTELNTSAGSDNTISNNSFCLDDLIFSNNRKCCNSACLECFGMFVVDCLVCNGSKFLADGLCLDECPLGYIQSILSTKCTRKYNKALYVKFNKPIRNFTDDISLKTFGEIGDFFTTFSKNHPIPVFQRGLFFNESKQISSEKMVFPGNFIVEIYIKILDSGVIFTKSNLSLSFNITEFKVTLDFFSSTFASLYKNEWVRLSLGFKTTLTRTNSLLIQENGKSSNFGIVNKWLIDDLSSIILGGHDSFTGFIYQLSIYTYSNLYLYTAPSVPGCSLSNQSNCVSTCQFDEFLFNNSNCSPCNNCSYGCNTEKHCNPCLDKHCKNCSEFQGLCFNCEKDYVLEKSSCGCAQRKYMEYDLDCYDCDYNCLQCSINSKNCTKCGNFSEIINNTCQCFQGFVEDKAGNFSSFQCRCSENSALINNSCVCFQGFVMVNNTCLPCDYNCLECSISVKNCTKCGNFSELINNTCQCFNTFIEDKIVNSSYFKCKCPENSALINNTCICNEGFVSTNDLCLPCHKNCLTCSGIHSYECLSCLRILNFKMCRNNCTVGFEIKDGKCEKLQSSQGIFKLKFDELKLPENDQINNIGIEYSGSSESQGRKSKSPASLLSRGIYFNGVSNYLKFPSQPLNISLLNYEFSLAFWMFPFESNDKFLTQSLGKNLSFLLSFVNQQVNISIMLGKNFYSFLSNFKVNISAWNNLVIKFRFINYTESTILINDQQDKLVSLSPFPYEEPIYSQMMIGYQNKDYFKGFLYLFAIFNEFDNFDNLALEESFCEVSNSTDCLSSCKLNFYYDFDQKQCFPCNKICDTSCRSTLSCTQCNDPYCKICESFYSECIECEANYELINSTCVACGTNYYFDSTKKKCIFCDIGSYPSIEKCVICTQHQFFDINSKKCKNCPDLCSTCESQSKCTSCIENAIHQQNFKCLCKKGYDPDNFCSFIPRNFTAWMKVTSENEVSLEFSEELSESLKKEVINVTLESTAASFSLKESSLIKYIIEIQLPKVISKGTKVKLIILSPLKSIFNSSLSNFELTAILFPRGNDDMKVLVLAAKTVAKQGVSAGLSAALGSSFLAFDPTSFFSFLSTAEMYYPLSLYSCDLPEDLSAFLASLRVQSMMPNIFALGIGIDSGSRIPEKFKRLGFKSNIMLINTGVNLSIALILIFLMALIKLASYSEKIKPYVKKVRHMFEYGIFIKFWIQSFLELFLGSLLSVKFNEFSSSIEIFDFFLGVVLIVLQSFGVLLLGFIMVKRSKVDEDNIGNFIISFGVIFDEFKNYGMPFWIFYLLYLIRRVFLISFAVFVDEGMIQVMVSFIFSLLMLFYIIFTRCFKNNISNIYMMVNEALALAASIVLMLYLIENPISAFNVNKYITRIITMAWGLNILYGVSLLSSKIALKLCKRKHAKVVDVNSFTSFDQSVNKSEKSSISELSENFNNETCQNQGNSQVLEKNCKLFSDNYFTNNEETKGESPNLQSVDISKIEARSPSSLSK